MIRNIAFAKITSAWNRFFFEPIGTETLGLFRIAFGTVALLDLLGRFFDRNFLYGAEGLISKSTVEQFFGGANQWLYFFGFVPDHDPALKWFLLILILLAALVTVGLYTRASSILLFLGLIALSNRNFFVENSGDDLLRIFGFYLMFTPAGAAYSLDWVRNRRRALSSNSLRPPKMNPWAFRLIQLQVAYVYLDTVFLKLHGPAWRDGTALYYALQYVELQRFHFSWLFHSLWQIRLETWGVLAVESSMFSLVWFRKTRYWCLLAALVLHLGINLVMQFPVFQYVMICGLIAFVAPEDATLTKLTILCAGATIKNE